MCFWLRQPLRDSYQTLANSELKIASVAFGKCREEYHYFFAPTSAGRSLRFCKKKRMPAAADRQGDVFLAVRILKL